MTVIRYVPNAGRGQSRLARLVCGVERHSPQQGMQTVASAISLRTLPPFSACSLACLVVFEK